jgi:hypothetical protein
LEVAEVVPWACFIASSVAAGIYAWRGDEVGVRYTLTLAGMSVAAAATTAWWRMQLDRVERQARFDNAIAKAREHQRGASRPSHPPRGRAVVNAELPPQWRQATHEPPH